MPLINKKTSHFLNIPRPWLYGGLLLAFLVKSIGASWDAAYHFKHLRDFLQLPHIVNGLGDILIAVIACYLWLKDSKHTRQLKIIFYGIFVFVVAIFFDQWYHAKFGIDLTTWSASHFMLYAGTVIVIVGTFLYILSDYRRGLISRQTKIVLSLVCLYFIFDNFWFPLLQQEQGVIVDYYLRHGIRLADMELLNLFFRTQHNVYSNLPAWLYGVWAVFSSVLLFQFVKRIQLHRFGATIIAGLYLIERVIMNTIFSLTNYPVSTIPYYLIFTAVIFDVLHNSFKDRPKVRDLVTSMVPTAGIMIISLLNPEIPIHPPIPIFQTFLFSIPAALAGYLIAVYAGNLINHQMSAPFNAD